MNISGLLSLVPQYATCVARKTWFHSSENIMSKAQSAGNQRHYSLVGTSETTRVAPYSKSFYEWLAYFILVEAINHNEFT